jgi:hypothetical protein
MCSLMRFQKRASVPVHPERIFNEDYIMRRAGSGKQK